MPASPWYAILTLPVLFAAGMSLLDTLDGSFMGAAYGWARTRPVRKVFYNIAITGLSVAVALAVGSIELGGLVWGRLDHLDVDALGFAIAGLFALTWAVAFSVWRLGRVEERWRAPVTERK